MYMRVINVSCDHVSSEAFLPGRVAQSLARLTQEPEVPGSIRSHTSLIVLFLH